MKKFIPKQKINHKKRYLIIGIALLLIMTMLLSVLDLSTTSETQKYRYNNYLFTKTDQGWLTYINNQRILLRFDPRSIENIPSDPISLSDLNSATKIYFSTNPDENLYLGLNEFSINQLITTNIVSSCTIDTEKCSDVPIKTCNDATQSTKVIILKESNLTKVTYQDNCLIIEGKSENLTKAVDRFLLTSLGIIK